MLKYSYRIYTRNDNSFDDVDLFNATYLSADSDTAEEYSKQLFEVYVKNNTAKVFFKPFLFELKQVEV